MIWIKIRDLLSKTKNYLKRQRHLTEVRPKPKMAAQNQMKITMTTQK